MIGGEWGHIKRFPSSVTLSTSGVVGVARVARPADTEALPPYRDAVSLLRFIPTSVPDHPLGDLAHLLRRQRAPQMVGALALALLSAVLLLRSEARATDAERRWGELSTVVVARDELRAGSDLGAAQVRLRRLPTATLASDALTEDAWNDLRRSGSIPVIDRNVAEDEPIRSGILVGDGAPGSGDGSVVAFPSGTLAPRLEPGDHVRVVAGDAGDLGAPELGGSAPGGGTPLSSHNSTDGVVVGPPHAPTDAAGIDAAATGPAEASSGWVAWVAVAPRDADEVARIALSGSVALVLDRPDLDGPEFDGTNPVNPPR